MAKKSVKSVVAPETASEAPMLALIDLPADMPAGQTLQPQDVARIVFQDAEKADQFYERIKAETEKLMPDVATAAGREAIRSLAFRVTKTKTTLDKAGLALTEEWRQKTAMVNAARKPMVERLDRLAADVRAPLTEWEDAETARQEANQSTIADIRAAAVVSQDDTSSTVDGRYSRIHDLDFPSPQWLEDEAQAAEEVKASTIQVLIAARERLRQQERDAAELEELRAERARIAAETAAREEAERAARAEAEAREREAREAQERAEREARQAEARAKAELERLERAKTEAAAEAKRRAEAEAQAERDRQAAEHRAELARVEAERERLEREAQEALAAAEREAEAKREENARIAAEAEAVRKADEARQRNRAHRSMIQREVKEAFMTCGLDEEQAKKVVLAIVAGNVPHTTIKF